MVHSEFSELMRCAGYADLVIDATDSSSKFESDAVLPVFQSASKDSTCNSDIAGEVFELGKEVDVKRSALREFVTLAVIAMVLYYFTLTFVARPYLIPSESMEPTLHGCSGCVGDRIMVDKISFRFGSPQPGDVIVFRGPSSWNMGYKSIRSNNTALRWLQNALSFVGFVPPDENDLVKRVIAVGGQTVACRSDTGLTVNGKLLKEPYLNSGTMLADPAVYRCLGSEFGPVTVPQSRLWVMGDNRTHSADSRVHCVSNAVDAVKGIFCTGDPDSGTVPVGNVIGKARFIVWPPSRWGGVGSVDPQQGR